MSSLGSNQRTSSCKWTSTRSCDNNNYQPPLLLIFLSSIQKHTTKKELLVTNNVTNILILHDTRSIDVVVDSCCPFIANQRRILDLHICISLAPFSSFLSLFFVSLFLCSHNNSNKRGS
eukprot:m.18382 g.18382  ORF g.18382 m.18382 type:complete len:119 (-) comp8309_c0_seq1:8-364(-)